MFYYTFTTFDCNFIPRNAEICKVSSETKNVGKAHKYRLNRHLPTYEKIIKNLYSFYIEKKAFYRGIDDDVPDEAECGGAGKHLYFIDDGDGHGVYHGLYVCGF